MTVYAITDTKKGRTGIAPTYLQTTQNKPHLSCSYTIFMFEETVVFCVYPCNHIVYVLLSNIKYSMTRISRNCDESTSSSTVCIILPVTKNDVIYRIFNQ